MSGRVLWAGLHLLDRQIVDRDGGFAGNVDDVELSPNEDGTTLFVTALHSGPGALSRRFGWVRFGAWRERFHQTVDLDLDRIWPIPMERVTKIGSSVDVDASVEELPAGATRKWVREHLIMRIPGSGHAPE
jgi:sporulation protein YlmC with PRC-barrel domain